MSTPAPATGNTYQANLYPATPQQNAATPTGAVCFSGGGSRALTCALGQLSALTGLSLLTNFKYISSVSGGSWASVLYNFLPATISDQNFLISYAAPGSLTQASMQTMPANCLGSVPQQFGIESVGDFLHKMWHWGALDPLRGFSYWFWIAAIGELVLKPFGLYDATYSSNSPYLLPNSFFSLSQEYVDNSLLPKNPGLKGVPCYYVSPNGRPTLIVNFNVLNGDYSQDPPQLPIQATAISTGAPGSTPGKNPIVGGGTVESFAFTSTLDSGGTKGQEASVTINRWYSLCDIAGCSSAFFAEYLLQYINKEIDDLIDYIAKQYKLSTGDEDLLRSILTVLIDVLSSQVIPAYNYWTLGEVGNNNPTNMSYEFSDGGDFENTGILGALAQTDVNRIVAFINSEIAINQSGSSYTVDPCLPILFGVGENGAAQVFDNAGAPGNTPLDQLCAGLYNASCGGPGLGSQLGTYTAAFTQTLTTVANQGIAAGRQITVLWVYNNRVNNWQSSLADSGLKNDLTKGQINQNSNGTPNGYSFDGPLPTLANFPYYDNGEQIYLPPEAVYMLAQVSAWNVEQLASQIQDLFQ